MSVSELIVGQVAAELDQIRDLYLERAPKTVLEIGVYYGGTLREWLTHAADNATVVAVDPQHRNPELYDGWKHPDTTLIVIDARAEDSHDEIEQHGPYDWVFIDGDHSEQGVLHDVSLALSVIAPGGLMLIHDIAYDTETPPRVEFDALTRDGHKTWEIIEEPGPDYPSNCAHGIGVVQLACVNPDHLEAVTMTENVLRGVGPTAVNARKTHCVNGHALEGDNVRPRSDGGRRCRECQREVDLNRRPFRLVGGAK